MPFFFQVIDHTADAGLGVIQKLGSLGKAAEFHGFDESHIFL